MSRHKRAFLPDGRQESKSKFTRTLKRVTHPTL
jgi:hypothetical protein